MIGPEVMRAFETWRQAQVMACQGCEELSGLASRHTCTAYAFTRVGMDVYPLYIGGPLNGRWYVRERMPGTRVWRAEDDGSFTLLMNDWTWRMHGPALADYAGLDQRDAARDLTP